MDQLSKELGLPYLDVALGSEESYEMANKLVEKGIREGQWILIKNVHLAIQWLTNLERILSKSNPNKNFRIFLASEFTSKIPSSLLKMSYKISYEFSEGIKQSALRVIKNIGPKGFSQGPKERSRLVFLVCWIHCVIIERLRYTPTGWSKKYEFAEGDLISSINTIDSLLAQMEFGENIPVDKIPFQRIRNIISNNIYGGKIDNEFDQLILQSIIEEFFHQEAFDNKKNIIQSQDFELKYPEALKFEEILSWIESIKAIESPEWSLLSRNIDNVIVNEKDLYIKQQVSLL